MPITFYVLVIVMCVISVIVCEIFLIEMRVTLTLTLTLTSRMGHRQMYICQRECHMRLSMYW